MATIAPWVVPHEALPFLDPIVLPALIWARVAARRDHGVIHNDAA